MDNLILGPSNTLWAVDGAATHPDLLAISSLGAPPGTPEELVEVMRQLMRAVLGLLADSARAADLNQTDYVALLRLVAAGEMTPLELRRIVGLNSSSIVVLSDRLEERKLITRVRQRGNRQRLLLRPTARGRSTIERTLGPVLKRMTEIGAALGDEDSVVVGRFLQQVAIGVSEIAPQPRSDRPVRRSRVGRP